MEWNELFPKDAQPTLDAINEYVASPLWPKLLAHVENTFGVQPKVEHSVCSGAPGWNVKYKKSGRALCTLYPHQGYFTALVCIGGKEQLEAELLLGGMSDYTQSLYAKTNPFNGSRWLMIDVTDERVLSDVEQLVGTRAKPKAVAK